MKSECTGFTLLETMVVCAIIAILGTITIAGFSAWLPNYRLKMAARELYATYMQVKLSAIKQHGNCTLTYSVSPAHQYVVTGVTRTVVLSDYGSGVRFAGPSGFATPSPPYDQAIVTFNSRGMSNFTSYVYLSNEKQTAHYRVGAMSTGAVKLEKWNGGTWQ